MAVFLRAGAFVLAALLACGTAARAANGPASETFFQAGFDAQTTLLRVFYAGAGQWRTCDAPSCPTAANDWGVDSATNALYLRWVTTHDPAIRTVMTQLVQTTPDYSEPCGHGPCRWWSDTPAWDAVTLMRENEVLGSDPHIVTRAQAALRYVEHSQGFAGGACPSVPYQLPQPAAGGVKTLETDANATKAALLLYRVTHDVRDLDDARARYTADRTYFLDPQVPLYTVHIVDDGVTCTQVPRRFFASVNGDMIWNGIELWRATGQTHFYNDAYRTAMAVATDLSDARGIFADVGGENDVVEPLVEAMTVFASREHVGFARDWILRNAAAALTTRAADGTFSRFFDGPEQAGASVWESNGGLALEIAAAGLDPARTNAAGAQWATPANAVAVTTLPATIEVDGSGVALVGTISKRCMKSHIRVLIDGVATTDQTGLWQNPSMPAGDSVFFAWRWPTAGKHTIVLEPTDVDQVGARVVDLRSVFLMAVPVVAAAPAAGSGDAIAQAPAAQSGSVSIVSPSRAQ